MTNSAQPVKELRPTFHASYNLFSDVLNRELRIRNQANIMANIFEDHASGLNINSKGASVLFGYFNKTNPLERKELMTKYEEVMKERGYVSVQ